MSINWCVKHVTSKRTIVWSISNSKIPHYNFKFILILGHCKKKQIKRFSSFFMQKKHVFFTKKTWPQKNGFFCISNKKDNVYPFFGKKFPKMFNESNVDFYWDRVQSQIIWRRLKCFRDVPIFLNHLYFFLWFVFFSCEFNNFLNNIYSSTYLEIRALRHANLIRVGIFWLFSICSKISLHLTDKNLDNILDD